MKILLCFGTRPEAIKMAPLFHELRERNANVEVCVTAQHREMLDQVLDFFEIIPNYDLNLMQAGQSLNELSSRILISMQDVFRNARPDMVVVHGDTSTSSMVALAAFHENIRVAHVEAGLRTFDIAKPFPEELNRQLTARISAIHFAPTEVSRENLLLENVSNDNIVVTGNTIVDSLKWAANKIDLSYSSRETSYLQEKMQNNHNIILVTGHRRESFGEGFNNLCLALLEISKIEKTTIVFPVHLNPQVRSTVYDLLNEVENIILIDPLNYPDFVWLMMRCTIIISDSGGIQEEAPTLKKPVLVTRTVSERMEGVNAGYSFLVGTDKNAIVSKCKELLKELPNYSSSKNPYGDGKASERITNYLLKK